MLLNKTFKYCGDTLFKINVLLLGENTFWKLYI